MAQSYAESALKMSGKMAPKLKVMKMFQKLPESVLKMSAKWP
jgi:hypothetical protein